MRVYIMQITPSDYSQPGAMYRRNPLLVRYSDLTDKVNDLYGQVDKLEDKEIQLMIEASKAEKNMKSLAKKDSALLKIKQASPYVGVVAGATMAGLANASPLTAVIAGVVTLACFFGERHASSKRPKLAVQFANDKKKFDAANKEMSEITNKKVKLEAEYNQTKKEWLQTRDAIEKSEEDVRKMAEAIKPPKLELRKKITDEGSAIDFGGVKLTKRKR